MNVLSLFDGIGTGRLALKQAGIDVNRYYASEIDKVSIQISTNNFRDIIQVGDVTLLNGKDFPKIDLLIAGSPCQGFSRAGKQLNFEDPRSKLFFEFVRLLKDLKPTFFLLENNKMKKEYSDIISGYLGVEPIEINSALVSAQNRVRLYWTNIPSVTIPEDRGITLKDIIGEYDGIYVYPRGFNKGGLSWYKGKCPCITTSSWQSNFHIIRAGVKEKFTVEQCEQLQTLPIGYTSGVCHTRRFQAIGNGWTTFVIEHILKNLTL